MTDLEILAVALIVAVALIAAGVKFGIEIGWHRGMDEAMAKYEETEQIARRAGYRWVKTDGEA